MSKQRLMKRTANEVGMFAHRVVNDIVEEQNTRKNAANNAYVLAKKLLAALPIVPTGERVWELTQTLQMGLLDDITGGNLDNVNDDNWQACVAAVRQYLFDIGVFLDLRK